MRLFPAARVSTVLMWRKSPPRGRENNIVSPSFTKPSLACTRSEAMFSAKAPEKTASQSQVSKTNRIKPRAASVM